MAKSTKLNGVEPAGPEVQEKSPLGLEQMARTAGQFTNQELLELIMKEGSGGGKGNERD